MIPTFIRPSVFALSAASLGLGGYAPAQDLMPTDFRDRPAEFVVTDEVIQEEVAAFTVTGPAFGNTLKRGGRGGFEPATFRTRLTAQRDAEDRVYDDRGAGLSFYDSYASGYLDGAEVRVYRLVDGRIELVRTDHVVEGGAVIEDWNRRDNEVIPAGTTTGQFRWADWSQPDAHRWFSVFAVDEQGHVSEAATPVRLQRRQADPGTRDQNTTERFRAGNGGDDQAPPAPENFTASYNARGIIEFSWDPVAVDDLAGYRIGRTDTDPAAHRGTYLQLAGEGDHAEEPIRAGDMVIVSKSLAGFDRSWLSHRIRNLDRTVRDYVPYGVPNGFYPGEGETRDWRLVRHEADTPVPDAGEYYFQMTLGEGDVELVGRSGIPDISHTQQDFYRVPQDAAEYVMEVWVKADREDAPPVVFTWDGDERIGGFVGEHPLEVSTQWQRQEVRFDGRSSDDGHHAYFVLRAEGPATYSFDNFRVYRADADYLDYLPEDYDALRASGVSAYRTHGPIKTGRQTYSMRQFLGGAGQTQGIHLGNTLPQMLTMMDRAGVEPWLQIEHHMSPAEWLGLVEYLAAPYDPATDTPETKPWAYLRHAQGRAEPWTGAFDRIYFELSNETWNRMFAPWTFDDMPDHGGDGEMSRGEVYGAFHDHVVGILQSSPYWNEALDEQFVHVLGGWATPLGRPDGYTQQAIRGSRTGELITIAAYNGGWDEGEGPPQTTPASYFNVLSQVNQTAIPRADELQRLVQQAQAEGQAIEAGVYEAGPGYALNGLNNARVSPEQAAEQEQVMKSRLAGTATLDSFLARLEHGFVLDNFFTFARGNLWKSHTHMRRGGGPHASFLPPQLYNQLIAGADMLEVQTVSVPTADTAEARRRRAIDDAPLAAVYAFRGDDVLTVVCISRRWAGYPADDANGITPLRVQLPTAATGAIMLHRLTGEPTDTNIDEPMVEVESVQLDPAVVRDGVLQINEASGSAHDGLGPSELLIYQIELAADSAGD